MFGLPMLNLMDFSAVVGLLTFGAPEVGLFQAFLTF